MDNRDISNNNNNKENLINKTIKTHSLSKEIIKLDYNKKSK